MAGFNSRQRASQAAATAAFHGSRRSTCPYLGPRITLSDGLTGFVLHTEMSVIETVSDGRLAQEIATMRMQQGPRRTMQARYRMRPGEAALAWNNGRRGSTASTTVSVSSVGRALDLSIQGCRRVWQPHVQVHGQLPPHVAVAGGQGNAPVPQAWAAHIQAVDLVCTLEQGEG
jgi:hypothetical protein